MLVNTLLLVQPLVWNARIAIVTHAVKLVPVFAPNASHPMFLKAENVLHHVPLKTVLLAVAPAQQPALFAILDSSLKAALVKQSHLTPVSNLLPPSDTRWL
jgi:hypothetical protein